MLALLIVLQLLATSEQKALSATDVTSETIVRALKEAKTDAPITDLQLRVVNVGGTNVGVAILRRTQGDTSALVHHKITEIYVIQEGAGFLETGGILVAGVALDPNPTIGPSSRGTDVQGAFRRRVKPGDVIVIPAGVPHRFVQLEGPITYLTVRVDPERVLPTK